MKTRLPLWLLAVLCFSAVGSTGNRATLIAHAEPRRLAADDGARRLYEKTCAVCHQVNGRGMAGAFPPHVGHVPQLVELNGGRTYLVRVVLFGLRGPIDVNGQHFDSAMPAWAKALSDEQIASILNYELTSWGNDRLLPVGFTPITAAEVAAQRAHPSTDRQMHETRQSMGFR
jgi:mono/diheme cytochrome c family protein